MLKVIVTGAFSTGKTDLVNSLADALIASGTSVALVPDVARSCPLPLNSNQTDDASLWLLMTQVSREIEVATGPEQVMLCDRGMPDVLAHHLEVLARGGGNGRVELLDRFVESWLETYDLILFSRLDESVPILGDGLRAEDATYRKVLDSYAARVLCDRKGVRELPFGDIQRLAYAREMVACLLSSRRLAPSDPRT